MIPKLLIRLYLVAIFFMFFHLTSLAQTNTASISGQVTTSDSKPAELVSISLKGTNKGTHSDKSGKFSFKNVKAGRYTIEASFIGLETQSKEIEIKTGEHQEVDFTLAESSERLQEIVVNGEKINKFAQKETDFVARLPLKNIENPQVYSVITSKLLEEQVITNVSDALKNAPGAIPIAYPSGGAGVISRGFRTGINARNGLETTTGRTSTDIANAERIEVIKGPSGTLFGSSVSSFGGVVNLVTKRPFETFGGNISYSLGGYGLNRVTADVNLPVNDEKTALFRVNGALHRENSFKNYGYNNTFTIAPSFSYKVNNRLSLLVDMEYFSVDQTRNTYTRIAPATGFKNMNDIPLDYKTILYNEDANAETTSSKYFFEAKYKISQHWTSISLVSYVSESVKHSYQLYNSWISPTQVARNVIVYGPIYNNYANIQQNVVGILSTGSIGHKLLVGVNYRRFYSNGSSSTGRNMDTVDVTKSYSPLTKKLVDNFIATKGGTNFWGTTINDTYSAYVSDVINFTKKLSAMLSLRLDRFDQAEGPRTERFLQTALSPKLGLVYEIVDDKVSIFGNYMNGFQNSSPVMQPDGTSKALDPIYANQTEAGIKIDAFSKKLNVTFSYYNIVIDNATRVNADLFTVQDGKQISKGTEVELISNPISSLNLMIGYVYNDNTYVRASSNEGKTSTDAPKHVMNFWASYKFEDLGIKNLGLGFGGMYADKSYFNADNTFTMPSYTILNASAFYDLPQFRLGLKVNNIGNQKSWDLWGTPQTLRQLVANVTFKF